MNIEHKVNCSKDFRRGFNDKRKVNSEPKRMPDDLTRYLEKKGARYTDGWYSCPDELKWDVRDKTKKN